MEGTSTDVKKNKDGTYTVVGGQADNSRAIYAVDKDGKRTSEIVGVSKTPNSFLDEKGNAVVGAVLDPKSNEGQAFVDKLQKDDPWLLTYMVNATNGEKYDVKDKGIDERKSDQNELQHRYRGSKDKNGEWGSARDYGNFGAGMVAGRKGLSWDAARVGFDTFQGIKSKGLFGPFGNPRIVSEREAPVSVDAEWLGFQYGKYKLKK
ncbi:hypothetical protein SAMN05421820_107193 [Pedobacter steynii]|uniref:Uncharacterized protein n=1 Tax=Pedobacter steynii TaxID=430522 RepID=A0A1H0ASV1_9SPHI|nr:hypothetical protein [Pedobacter steynii]SDN36608.1 hypothetical protein SAMN05421820_107193 [Pedobacter steynii]